jgi:HupE / UreJ protein
MHDQHPFIQGILHITDIQGYDHMLFLLALTAGLSISEWKKALVLATAFTFGHSVTLALAAFNIVHVSGDTIEILIACTIAATALFKIINTKENQPVTWALFLGTASFGLIHGLGFSSFFRMMYSNNADVLRSLLFFNLGVEAGQIIIIAILLLINFFVVRYLKLSNAFWKNSLAIFALLVSIMLIIERWSA